MDPAKIQNHLNVGFIKNVIQSSFARLISAVLALAISVIIARNLGPDGQGLYAATAALSLLGMQLGNMGIHAANTFFVAQNPKLTAPLLGNSIISAILFGGIAAVTIYSLTFIRPDWIAIPHQLLPLALLWIPAHLGYIYFQAILLGLQNVRSYNLVDVLHKVLPLVAILTYMLVSELTLEHVLSISIFSTWALTLFAYLKISKTRSALTLTFSWPVLRNGLRYGVFAFLASLFSFLVLKIDILMIQSISGEQQSGIYSVASSLGDVVCLFPVVVGTLLFSKLSSQTDAETRYTHLKKVLRHLLIISSFITLTAAILARPMITILYGKAFLPTVESFFWLLPGLFCLSLSIAIQNYLATTRKPWLMSVGPAVALLINVPLNLYLIPLQQATGAAIASSISYAVWLGVGLTLVKKFRPRQSGPGI